MTELEEEKAFGMALVHWLETQDAQPHLTATVLARTLGIILAIGAKDSDHLSGGVDLICELIKLEAIRVYAKRQHK